MKDEDIEVEVVGLNVHNYHKVPHSVDFLCWQETFPLTTGEHLYPLGSSARDFTIKHHNLPIKRFRYVSNYPKAFYNPLELPNIEERYFVYTPEVEDLLHKHKEYFEGNIKLYEDVLKLLDTASFWKRLKYLFTKNRKHLT